MILLFWFMNISVVIVGATLSHIQGMPEDLRRAGATISALSALFVVWQVWMEIRFQRDTISGAKTEFSTWDSLSPIEQRALAMESQQAAEKEKARMIERMKLVVSVAIWASAGEILHGFGDIIARGLYIGG
jgi:hypothetical protein